MNFEKLLDHLPFNPLCKGEENPMGDCALSRYTREEEGIPLFRDDRTALLFLKGFPLIPSLVQEG
jgi:hypothetical protein